MNKIIKKINLENFPKHNGYGKKNIDWVNSKGCSGTFYMMVYMVSLILQTT